MSHSTGHAPKRDVSMVDVMRADFPDKAALSARMGGRRAAYKELTWNPGAIAPGGVFGTTFSFQGAAVGDVVIADHSAVQALGLGQQHNISVFGRVTSADNVTVWMRNFSTGSTINPANGTIAMIVFVDESTAP